MEEKDMLKSIYTKLKIGMDDFKKIQNLLLHQEEENN